MKHHYVTITRVFLNCFGAMVAWRYGKTSDDIAAMLPAIAALLLDHWLEVTWDDDDDDDDGTLKISVESFFCTPEVRLGQVMTLTGMVRGDRRA
jgi:hypothetical protein